MKKINLIVLSVFMMFVAYGCKHVDSQTTGLFDQSQQNVSALKLLKESFNANQVDTVVSGLSVDFAIDMLANGAQGKSLEQLESFLNTTVVEKNFELQKRMRTMSKSLELSNSIWGNNFKPSYKSLVKDLFKVTVQSLPKNTSTINNWISAKTHGKITSLLDDEATNPLSLYLINTIYFKDAWSTPFDKNNTSKEVFYSLSGKNTQVPMMHKKGSMLYARTSKIQSVRLPYENGGFMSIYLPQGNQNFSEFLSDLSAKDLNLSYEYQKVKLSLPRFKVDTKTDITQIFKNLGIDEIFNVDNNDLTDLSEVGAYVKDIRQKATVEVNEEGTEAAAATSVEAMSKGLEYYIPFEANKPFVFVVSEGDFVGVYTGN